jgi:two-component system phosphate regulon sensor histidine kinase PhoR
LKERQLRSFPVYETIKISASVLLISFLYLFIFFTVVESYAKAFQIGFVLIYSVNVFVLIYFLINRYFRRITKRVSEILEGTGKKGSNITIIKSPRHFEEEIGQWAEIQNLELSKLKDMEAYRKEFLGNVSHELKTPLFIAQSYIETLIDGSLYDKKVSQKHLYKALKNILRLTQIVKDLEMISQFERKALSIEKRRYDVHSQIRELAESLEMSTKVENVEIIIDIEENRKCYVFADEEKIEQVLANLVVNAIKYSKNNGMVVLKCNELKDRYLVEILDNGIGISPKNLDRIFERFYRVEKHRSRKKGGTGLGLSIVKHILEAHDESITVESEPGKGTKFTFSLRKA